MEGALSVVLLPNLSISITPDEKLLGDVLQFDTTLCKESFYFFLVLAITQETVFGHRVQESRGFDGAKTNYPCRKTLFPL